MSELLTQLNEVGSRDGYWLVILRWVTAEWWFKIFHIRDIGITRDTIEILDTALGW